MQKGNAVEVIFCFVIMKERLVKEREKGGGWGDVLKKQRKKKTDWGEIIFAHFSIFPFLFSQNNLIIFAKYFHIHYFVDIQRSHPQEPL